MKVLVTGVGGTASFGIVQGLEIYNNKIEVIGTDANEYAPGIYYPFVKKAYLVPGAFQDNYIRDLSKIVIDENIDFIIPSPDHEVLMLSKYQNDEPFKGKLLLPSYDVVLASWEKDKCFDALKRNNIPCADYKLIKSEKNIKEFTSRHKPPYFLKRRASAGGKQSIQINNSDLIKPYIDNFQGWGEFIICEFLQGREFNVFGFYLDGKLISSAGYEKIRYVQPEAKILEIQHNDERNLLAEKAMKALGMDQGVCNVDMKMDLNGKVYVHEINAGRAGSTIQAFVHYGLNFSELIIKKLSGVKMPKLPQYNALPKGLHFLRTTDISVFVHKNELLSTEGKKGMKFFIPFHTKG